MILGGSSPSRGFGVVSTLPVSTSARKSPMAVDEQASAIDPGAAQQGRKHGHWAGGPAPRKTGEPAFTQAVRRGKTARCMIVGSARPAVVFSTMTKVAQR